MDPATQEACSVHVCVPNLERSEWRRGDYSVIPPHGGCFLTFSPSSLFSEHTCPLAVSKNKIIVQLYTMFSTQQQEVLQKYLGSKLMLYIPTYV